jgi:hypothetical protein
MRENIYRNRKEANLESKRTIMSAEGKKVRFSEVAMCEDICSKERYSELARSLKDSDKSCEVAPPERKAGKILGAGTVGSLSAEMDPSTGNNSALSSYSILYFPFKLCQRRNNKFNTRGPVPFRDGLVHVLYAAHLLL